MHWYDRKGRPIDMHQANAFLMDPDYKRVAIHEEGGFQVSTVWLGTNHNWTGRGAPILFETMIFGPDSWASEYMERYPTEEAALAGHDQAIMHLRNEILPRHEAAKDRP